MVKGIQSLCFYMSFWDEVKSRHRPFGSKTSISVRKKTKGKKN